MKSPAVIVYSGLRSVSLYLSIFIATLFVIVFVAPVFFDVEQFRPLIQRLASDEINSKVEFHNLKVDFWGGLRISAQNVEIISFENEKIAEAERIFFSLNLLTFLRGDPHTLIQVENPVVNLDRSEGGEFPFLKTLRDVESHNRGKEFGHGDGHGLLAWLMSWNLHLHLMDLVFRTKKTAEEGFSYQSDPLDLLVVGLSRTNVSHFTLRKSSSGRGKDAPQDLMLEGELSPLKDESGKKQLHLQWVGHLAKLENLVLEEIAQPKAREVATNGEMIVSTKEVQLQKCQIKTLGMELQLTGGVVGVDSLKPVLDIKAVSAPIDLSTLEQFILLPADLRLKGRTDLAVDLQADVDQGLRYSTEVNGQGITLSHQVFLVSPVIEFFSKFSEKSLQQFDLRIEAPESEIGISAEVPDFKNPSGTVDIVSSGINSSKFLDLDNLKSYLNFFALTLIQFDAKAKLVFNLDLRKVTYGKLEFENLKTRQKSIRSLLLYLSKAISRAEKRQELLELSRSKPTGGTKLKKNDEMLEKQKAKEDNEDVLKKYGF